MSRTDSESNLLHNDSFARTDSSTTIGSDRSSSSSSVETPLFTRKATVADVQADAQKLTEDFHNPDKAGFQKMEPKDFLALKDQISNIHSMEGLTSTIRDLEIKVDQRLGITRYKKPEAIATLGHDAAHKDAAIVRDATKQKTKQIYQKPEDTPEAGLMSILGTTRGAFDMIDKSEHPNKTALKQEILKIAKKDLDKMYQNGKVTDTKKVIEEIEHTQTKIVLKLHESDLQVGGAGFEKPKDLAKALGDFRDACNMKQDEPNHLVSVIKGQHADTVTTISAKVTPLSEAQRKDLQEIKDSDILPEDKPKWFQDLKPYQKEIVKDNADKILEENITIPTTLRFMPGVRNILSTTDFKTKDKTTTLFNDNFRTATPSYYAGKDGTDLDVTKQNLEHVRSVAGGKINYQIYNNSIRLGDGKFYEFQKHSKWLLKDEDKIVSLAKKATSELDIGFSSVSQQLRPDKIKMVDKIVKGPETSKAGEKRVIACKSGKDRTSGAQEVITNNAYLKHLESRGQDITTEKKTALSTARSMSAHNATIANQNNHGSFGLKTKGSYAAGKPWKAIVKAVTSVETAIGRDDKRSLLGDKKIDENKLAKLNAIELSKDLVKAYKKEHKRTNVGTPTKSVPAREDHATKLPTTENPLHAAASSKTQTAASSKTQRIVATVRTNDSSSHSKGDLSPRGRRVNLMQQQSKAVNTR